MGAAFILREMTFSDGPAINALAAECPDGGLISVRSVFRENAWHSLKALRPNTVGMAAEAAGHDWLIGMGLVSIGRCRVDGVTVPYALLNTLMVHPKWRKEGVAGCLADWWIAYARSRLGNEGLLLANIQAGNAVSHRMVRKWSSQVLPGITVAPVTVRRREPKASPGVIIRPLEDSDMEEFAHRLNGFYEGYTLFQPETAESLFAWISQKPSGRSIHRCLTVTDPQGRLLGGLALEEACQLRTYQVVHMPPALRIANRLLHVVPADGVLREILVNRFWFRPGREAAARCLWERSRWECRNRGTSLMAFFDPRSPLARVIQLKPWSIRTSMNPVIRWPTPVSADCPISPIP